MAEPTQSKILVTGANGQLGQCFRDLSVSSPNNYVFAEREVLDITDVDSIERYILKLQPEIIINCAAYTAVDKAEESPEQAFLINEKSVLHLAKACKKHDILFIHYSTDYVYHLASTSLLTETDNCKPQGVYARSKRAGEQTIFDTDADAIILRTSWVYSEHGNNFVKTMLRLFEGRDSLNVVNDQIGTPTYAPDIAEVTELIIQQHNNIRKIKGPHIYNFSNNGETHWAAFAQAIAALVHSPIKINQIPSSEYPTPAPRPLWSMMSKDKIIRDFNVSLRPWRESLEKCINKLATQAS